VSRLRQDRKAEADYTAAVQALVDAGVIVVERRATVTETC
jgi:hypothetical protein